MFQQLIDKINDVVWGNELESKGMPGHVAALLLRHVYALVRDIIQGQLPLRATSLVYTTLLSIVPLVAFSFSVLKGLGVHNDLRPYMYEVLEPLGAQGREITDELINLVDNVKGGVLGGLSLAFFIYTSIQMVQKVEESFNHVWHVSRPRSFARRFSEYTLVLLISPVIVVVALGMIASINSNRIVQALLENESFGPMLVKVGEFAPSLLITAVFIFLYMFVPNTRVRFVPAAIGGVFGGVLWAAIGAVFANFLAYTTTKMIIYQSFAVAISALLWLYLSWLVLLVGAQLAFYIQHPEYLRIGRRDPHLSNSMRECLALNVMYLVANAYRGGSRIMSFDELAEKLKVPAIALAPVVNRLEQAGLLLSTEREGLVPGRDMARIRLSDILEVVRKRGDTGSYRGPRWLPGIAALAQELDDAVTGVVGERTLADLVDELSRKP